MSDEGWCADCLQVALLGRKGLLFYGNLKTFFQFNFYRLMLSLCPFCKFNIKLALSYVILPVQFGEVH